MKTVKLLLGVVSVLVIGGLTFASPVTASCGKKSKATSASSADNRALRRQACKPCK